MKNKFFITLLLILTFFTSTGFTYNPPIKTMTNVETKMLYADYWVNKLSAPDKVIMSPQEISDYNSKIADDKRCYVHDLTKLSDTFSKASILTGIDVKFPEKDAYFNGIAVSQDYWSSLKTQLNIDNLKDVNAVNYGIAVKRTNLKVYPTTDIISDSPNDLCYDQFQNSAVLVNEPVLILHKSLDEKWYFVYSYNCAGWVLASDVGICGSKEDWIKYQNINDFVVVTANKFKLEANPVSPDISELELTMGTKLPLFDQTNLPPSIDGRALYDNYIVQVPTRDLNGLLSYKPALIPVSKDISIGYLPYTQANILKQAFKMEGDRYGWGGMLDARDCSSLILELYHCFGFNLPRNTSTQALAPGGTFDFSNLTIDDRYKLLDTVPSGSALYFPGHTMIYLGKNDSHYYVISSLGSIAEFANNSTDPKIVSIHSVTVSDLSLKRASGKQWIEALTVGKNFAK